MGGGVRGMEEVGRDRNVRKAGSEGAPVTPPPRGAAWALEGPGVGVAWGGSLEASSGPEVYAFLGQERPSGPAQAEMVPRKAPSPFPRK